MKNYAFHKWLLLGGLCILALLVLAGCAGGDQDSIQNVIWEWASLTEQSSGETTTVPNPENYTVIFYPEGLLTGEADCNAFSGNYSEEGGFSIQLGPSTLAFCGEASLDQQFLNLLSNAAAAGPDGSGSLAIETAGGAQRMLFNNGGDAPAP